MIELYANSLKREMEPELKKEGLWPIPIKHAPFFAVLPGPAAIIISTLDKRYYYPNELGKALYNKGVETCIQCHSGKECINGEYAN